MTAPQSNLKMNLPIYSLLCRTWDILQVLLTTYDPLIVGAATPRPAGCGWVVFRSFFHCFTHDAPPRGVDGPIFLSPIVRSQFLGSLGSFWGLGFKVLLKGHWLVLGWSYLDL